MVVDGFVLVFARRLGGPGFREARQRLAACLGVTYHPPGPEAVASQVQFVAPAGVTIDSAKYLPGETAHSLARRVFPLRIRAVLCGADQAPVDPEASVGATAVYTVIDRPFVSTTQLMHKNMLGLFRWAIVDGSSWPWETTHVCAEEGYLEMLRWAVAHGCLWHAGTSLVIAARGNLELLVWALAHGCNRHYCVNEAATRNGHQHILDWLETQ